MRGRFAPSPSGPLHFGSLVAALASWLDARHARGEWLVRIEDVDETRTMPGAADEILRTLESFGLHWDGAVQWQSRRKAMYEEALDRLRGAGLAYRCRCSRKEIADSGLRGIEGAVYPGTCRNLQLGTDVARAERFIVPAGKVEIEDRLQGTLVQDVAQDVGDFVLKRRDRLHGYQLAVVVDDAAMEITEVVRGEDLLKSTGRQLLLYKALGLATPSFYHCPLVNDAMGNRLAKRHDALSLRSLRASGATPEELRRRCQELS